MSKFNKLSRAEMRNVLGGVIKPPSGECTNDCGGTSGACADGYTCKLSQPCPGETEFTHNVCKANN